MNPSGMHRSYSLRSNRALTAAQLQSPPPPPSTTRNRFFGGRGIFSHQMRKSIAGAMGPEMARRPPHLGGSTKNLRAGGITLNAARLA